MVESLMHDKGYTYFDLPRLHYGEMRRLAEGVRLENVMEKEAVEASRAKSRAAHGRGGASGKRYTNEYQRMRSESKRRAVERYKQKHMED